MIRQFSHLELHLHNIEIEYYLMISLNTLVSNLSIFIIYQKWLLRTTVPLSTGSGGYLVDCLFVICAKAMRSSDKVLPTLSTDVKKIRHLSKNKVNYLVFSVQNWMIMFLCEKEEIKKRPDSESFFYVVIILSG